MKNIPGLTVDLDGATPVYRQIAEGVRAALLDGRLEAGNRLPPTRDLARQLGVNRNTVVSAYDLLAADGAVESRTGRGTFILPGAVAMQHPSAAAPAALRTGDTAATPWVTEFSRAVGVPGIGQLRSIYRTAISQEGISFAGTYPAPELMPVEAFRRAVDTALREDGREILAYGPTAGHPPLRGAIAADMRRRGSQVGADGVLVTNGAQQAIDLAFRALLDRGDTAVVEHPTYTGALSSLGSLGARIVGVPLDEQGVRPDLLALALERHRPKLIYLQPTLQNPTTTVMSAARRREVLNLAARYRCVVVEDDWAGDLYFDEANRQPSLHALDGGRSVIYLSTFSKKLFPGLRVGWLCAPPPVTQRLVELKQVQDFGTSPLVQASLHRFLVDGGLSAHLETVLPLYLERRNAMLDAADEYFPETVRWTKPDGGLFVWAELPQGMNSNDLFVAARAKGVSICRGELFYSNGVGSDAMRLAYGAATVEQITAGMQILGDLMKDAPAGGPDNQVGAAEVVPIL